MEDNTLPIWFPQYKPCPKCQQGFIIEEGKARKCKCKIEYEIDVRLLSRMLDANILVNSTSSDNVIFLKNYSITSYKGLDTRENLPKIEKFISKFEEKYNYLNLFFSGKPGTQKTVLSKYILTSLLRKGLSGYYIIADDLISLLIDAERNEGLDLKTKYILNVDCLVIDEMDEEKITLFASNWQQKHFFPFLKNRLETISKSTIFISNKTIDDLGKAFAGAIQDVVAREVPDKTMVFEDRYSEYRGNIDLSKLWED